MAVFFDQSFSGAELSYNDGVASATWVYDDEIGDAGTDLYTAATAVVAWLNHSARPWFGARAFALEMTTLAPCHGVSLTVSGGAGAWTVNAALASATQIPAGTTAALTISSAAGVVASVAVPFAFRRWRPMSGGPGTTAQGGSWHYDPPHARAKTADVTTVARAREIYAMTRAVEVATTPRRAVIYDSGADTHRRVLVAEIDTRRGRYLLNSVTLTVVEAA